MDNAVADVVLLRSAAVVFDVIDDDRVEGGTAVNASLGVTVHPITITTTANHMRRTNTILTLTQTMKQFEGVDTTKIKRDANTHPQTTMVAVRLEGEDRRWSISNVASNTVRYACYGIWNFDTSPSRPSSDDVKKPTNGCTYVVRKIQMARKHERSGCHRSSVVARSLFDLSSS